MARWSWLNVAVVQQLTNGTRCAKYASRKYFTYIFIIMFHFHGLMVHKTKWYTCFQFSYRILTTVHYQLRYYGIAVGRARTPNEIKRWVCKSINLQPLTFPYLRSSVNKMKRLLNFNILYILIWIHYIMRIS